MKKIKTNIEQAKRLLLSKEKLRELQPEQLPEVVGGGCHPCVKSYQA